MREPGQSCGEGKTARDVIALLEPGTWFPARQLPAILLETAAFKAVQAIASLVLLAGHSCSSLQPTRPMGSHGGRRHRNGATLRAKLALEIPAVPLEVLALGGSLLYLLKSRGSGDAARQLPGCQEG